MYRALLVGIAALVPLWAHAGEVSPRLLVSAGPSASAASRPVEVTVRFAAPPSEAELDALSGVGAGLRRVASGAPAVVGRAARVRVERGALEALAALPGVERVEPATDVVAQPSDWNVDAIGAPGIWSVPPPALGTRGRGVVIGLFDWDCDVFHPDLLRADGGVYDFEDTDGDGAAGPGDRVDLDRDGTFESTLSLLAGQSSGHYDPAEDWLFVDENRDGVRDAGAQAGYDDATPAMGEPVFVGDDLDGSGRVEVGERLVRLGTSKILAASTADHRYVRGVDLSSHPPVGGTSRHCVSTTGLLVGGVPGLRTHVGVAPEADLVLLEYADVVLGLAESADLGARVHVYEFVEVLSPSSGRTVTEEAISDAARAGLVEVTPTGNLARAERTMVLEPVPADPASVRLDPSRVAAGDVDVSFAWVGAPEAVTLTLVLPDGTRVALSPSADALTEETVTPYRLTVVREAWGATSALRLYIAPDGVPSLPRDVLTIEASAPAGGVTRLRGVLWDVVGWEGGARWLDRVSEAFTALSPSTADETLAVTAFVRTGDRASYASMGPRIDGAPVVDIAAPTGVVTTGTTDVGGPYLYRDFGGTSAALPHAGAAAALLLALDPTLDHDSAVGLLGGGAQRDALTGPVSSESFGEGKLRVDAAWLGAPVPDGGAPTVELTVESEATVGAELRVQAVVDDPDGDAADALVAWDVGYDLVYERPPSTGRMLSFVPNVPGPLPVVAQAVDPTGRTARALVVVDVGGEALDGGGEVDAAVDGGGGDAGGEDPTGVDAGTEGPSVDADGGAAATAATQTGCGCEAGGAGGAGWALLLAAGLLVGRFGRKGRARAGAAAGGGPGARPGAGRRARSQCGRAWTGPRCGGPGLFGSAGGGRSGRPRAEGSARRGQSFRMKVTFMSTR